MTSAKRAIAVAVALLLAGCTVQKEPLPVAGSRANGTVTLEYSVYFTDTAEVDYAAALERARKICAGWGYTGAEPFGGRTSRCAARNPCNTTVVSLPYQCTGAPATR